MHALLAFLPRPEGGTAPISRQWMEASDWGVLFTLGTLFFLLGSFATWAWIIWRRTTKPAPHIRLLMELEDETEGTKQTASREKPEPTEPWEQPGDWWKKKNDDRDA